MKIGAAAGLADHTFDDRLETAEAMSKRINKTYINGICYFYISTFVV
jgi:hypothetical protein